MDTDRVMAPESLPCCWSCSYPPERVERPFVWPARRVSARRGGPHYFVLGCRHCSAVFGELPVDAALLAAGAGVWGVANRSAVVERTRGWAPAQVVALVARLEREDLAAFSEGRSGAELASGSAAEAEKSRPPRGERPASVFTPSLFTDFGRRGGR